MIAKIREPKPAVHQNIQLIATEQQDPEPRVNIVTRSGVSTSGTSQETETNTSQPGMRRVPKKAAPLDLRKNKEAFQEAKMSFTNPTTQDRRYLHLVAYRSRHLAPIALNRHHRLPHQDDAIMRI